MTAFSVLYLCTFGIGALFPISRNLGFRSVGLRMIFGFLTLPLLIYFQHSILKISLQITCKIIVGIALIGLLKQVITSWYLSHIKLSSIHPIILAPLVVLALAQFQGGVTYLPYSGDEFSSWLTIPKQAFALGEFDREQMRTSVKDYVPSWYLWLLFPSILLSDTFSPSYSALVPLIFHIGLICLIFDLVFEFLKKTLYLTNSWALGISWVIILLLLTVQSSGALIAKNLLIEPPQIYGFTAIFILLAAKSFPWTSNDTLLKLTGVLFALTYLIKSSFLVLAPAFIMFLGVKIFDKNMRTNQQSVAEKVRNTATYSLYLLGPFILILALWKLSFSGSQTPTGSPSLMFSMDYLEAIGKLNVIRVTSEFNTAVFEYLYSYKFSLTMITFLSLLYALRLGQWRALAASVLTFIFFYYLALYWSHLTLFASGPTSIPRYMRIPIQVIHTVGLYFITISLFGIVSKLQTKSFLLFLLPENKEYYISAVLIFLGTWQIFQAHYVMADLGTRNNQHLAPHTLEIRSEAISLDQLVNFYGPNKKNILLINHPHQPGIHKYAWYHLVRNTFSQGLPNASITQFRKLSPEASLGQSQKDWKEEFFQNAAFADIIWPVETVDPSGEIFKNLNVPKSCRIQLNSYFLIRASMNKLDFVCIKKF